MSRFFDLGFGRSEESSYAQLPVIGKIPSWLEGVVIRNGPGTFAVGHESYRHWFDGLAMLHRFTISAGRVSYMSRFLHCKAYDEAMAQGKIRYSEFATDPTRSALGRMFAVFDQRITDSAKVNVTRLAGKYLALGETSKQIEFDPNTLQALGEFNYEKKYRQHITTVHPQFDLSENAAYQLVTRFGRRSHYRFIRIGDTGVTRVVGEIPVSEPAYLHSFGLSPSYIILAEFPFLVQPLALLFQIKPFIENFYWRPKRGTRFYIMDRNTGTVVYRPETEAFFAFHHINAFERGDELIIDINAYPDAGVIQAFYLKRIEDEKSEIPFGTFRRFRVDLKTKKIASEQISDQCLELSNFDYRRLNMDGNYQYVYGVGLKPNQRQGFYNQLIKIDLRDQSTRTWHVEKCFPGEPLFVGKPGRTREDEGVILSVVLDEAQGNSFLLILEAHSLSELARVQVPHPILMGYHGAFFKQI